MTEVFMCRPCAEKLKAAGLSDSSLYKQAGNSIVVNVMVFIFAPLFNIKVDFYDI